MYEGFVERFDEIGKRGFCATANAADAAANAAAAAYAYAAAAAYAYAAAAASAYAAESYLALGAALVLEVLREMSCAGVALLDGTVAP